MANTLLSENARLILRAAASDPVGIEVAIEVPPGIVVATPALRAKQVLYRFKQENSDFSHIQIRLSPHNPDKALWLINARSTPADLDPRVYYKE